jgi:SAM-dependent methyltransferase
LRDSFYNKIAGSHPKTNAFHHQWAMNRLLLDFSKQQLTRLPVGSSVLDVGVGSAPYWNLRRDLDWRGIDVIEGQNVDFLINKDSSWPIQDSSFDYILCTQVIEHVENPAHLVSEIRRVLKPGGSIILNAPFLYPFHGMPQDQMRYTTSQLEYFFKDFEILECGTLGGVGSSIATIWLNFVNYQISQSSFLQLLKVFLFPLWLLGNVLANLLFVSLDKFDTTKSFPLNTYLVATLPR